MFSHILDLPDRVCDAAKTSYRYAFRSGGRTNPTADIIAQGGALVLGMCHTASTLWRLSPAELFISSGMTMVFYQMAKDTYALYGKKQGRTPKNFKDSFNALGKQTARLGITTSAMVATTICCNLMQPGNPPAKAGGQERTAAVISPASVAERKWSGAPLSRRQDTPASAARPA